MFKNRLLVTISIALLLFSSLTLAHSYQYWGEGHVLKVLDKHDLRYWIVLSNFGNTEEKYVAFTLGKDNYTKIEGTNNTYVNYTLEPGEKKQIWLLWTQPENSSIGDKFPISWEIKEGSSGEGMISIGMAYSRSFNVLIVSQNPPEFIHNLSVIKYSKGILINYDINCTDQDGDPVYYYDNTDYFNINETTGEISWTPEIRFKTLDVNITCSDGYSEASGLLTFQPKLNYLLIGGLSLGVILLILVVFLLKRKKKKKESKPHKKDIPPPKEDYSAWLEKELARDSSLDSSSSSFSHSPPRE